MSSPARRLPKPRAGAMQNCAVPSPTRPTEASRRKSILLLRRRFARQSESVRAGEDPRPPTGAARHHKDGIGFDQPEDRSKIVDRAKFCGTRRAPRAGFATMQRATIPETVEWEVAVAVPRALPRRQPRKAAILAAYCFAPPLKTAVPATRILAPASTACLAVCGLIPPSTSSAMSRPDLAIRPATSSIFFNWLVMND